jgi:hypothetical protein
MTNTKKASWLLGFGAQDNNGVVITMDVVALQKKDMVMILKVDTLTMG